MARRWSKHLEHTSTVERIYWRRTLPREIQRNGPDLPPTDEMVARAWERAQAIGARYKQLKQYAARQARKAARA